MRERVLVAVNIQNTCLPLAWRRSAGQNRITGFESEVEAVGVLDATEMLYTEPKAPHPGIFVYSAAWVWSPEEPDGGEFEACDIRWDPLSDAEWELLQAGDLTELERRWDEAEE